MENIGCEILYAPTPFITGFLLEKSRDYIYEEVSQDIVMS